MRTCLKHEQTKQPKICVSNNLPLRTEKNVIGKHYVNKPFIWLGLGSLSNNPRNDQKKAKTGAGETAHLHGGLQLSRALGSGDLMPSLVAVDTRQACGTYTYMQTKYSFVQNKNKCFKKAKSILELFPRNGKWPLLLFNAAFHSSLTSKKRK